jgi:superfamily I DNA/RNA helicase
MNDYLKYKLDEEQNVIVEADEKYIVVSACPGSGKTYTLVKRIEKELQSIEPYKGIIACSFTNEASEEIKNRLGNTFELSASYISTIDAFIKNIILMFVNRALDSMNIAHNQIISPRVSIPTGDFLINGRSLIYYDSYGREKKITYNDIVRYSDRNDDIKKYAKEYTKDVWLKKIKSSEYEVSFSSYYFAIKIIRMDIFLNWFNNHFATLYIDEAQDLNWFQHLFFKEIKERTNLRIVMFGDPNQSIYQFRGAKPELFRNLVNNGYKEYNLSYSLRCNPNITDVANNIYREIKISAPEPAVFLINNVDLDFLNSLEGKTYILTDKNSDALAYYDRFKNDYDVVYSKQFDLSDEYIDYKDNSLIVDELIKYYFNYDNEEDKYRYPYMKIEPYIKVVNSKVKKADFDLQKYDTIVDFLEMANNILEIGLISKTINKIGELLNMDEYKYNYYVSNHKNKIMTIHTSKGLESDNVVICLTNKYDDPRSEEFKNKLFVAITRAKNHVYIYSISNENVKKFIESIVK